MQELRHQPFLTAGRSNRVRREDVHQAEDGRRTSNAKSILRAVLDNGPVARSTIARLTALSPATVSRQCTELVRLGLLREAAEVGVLKGPGRPHISVDIDVDRHLVCGLHIAVAHTTLALVDLRGRVVAQERRPHAGSQPERVLSGIAGRVLDFIAEHAHGRVPLGLGVATGGWVDPSAGVIVENASLGWRDVPVRALLAGETGLPVRVDSHSRALARAEQLFGEARARASVVNLFVGNMVDAAFATGGMVHHGPRSAAGDVAHLPLGSCSDRCSCGRVGCFEAAVSERRLCLQAVGEGIVPEPSVSALLTAARAGDGRAVRLFRERARLVGRAAALLLDVLNPEVLVVVEAGVIHLPECLAELRAEVRRRSRVHQDPEKTVVATSFVGEVLAVAAGTVMLDAVYADPLAARLPVFSPTF